MNFGVGGKSIRWLGSCAKESEETLAVVVLGSEGCLPCWKTRGPEGKQDIWEIIKGSKAVFLQHGRILMV
ncbi:hypothetical protein ACRRTK_012335 [Alexandromys fortis]